MKTTVVISWHEDSRSYWSSCPDWKNTMITNGYTIGEVNTINGMDEFTLKKMLSDEGYHRIQKHDLKVFIGNLTDPDRKLAEEE